MSSPIVWVLFLSLGSSVTDAQTTTDGETQLGFDSYGNARSLDLELRPGGVLDNGLQGEVLRDYWTFGRRLDQRRGGSPFALPGDMRARSGGRTRSARQPADTLSAFGLSRARRRAFDQYGGFERRPRGDDSTPLASAFARRYALIGATSLNAPVYRALSDFGGALAVGAGIDRRARATDGSTVGTASASRFDQRLREGVDHAHLRAVSEGWARFREGQYRRAARAFESATLLQPSDAGARIGELFSYLSVGATRTAVAVLRELSHRDANPFLYDLKMTDAYGDAAEAAQLRVRLRLQAYSNTDNADLQALYVLVLWHLDERNEALVTATSLARGFAASQYADWPAKIDAAKKTLPAGGDP